jgi:hypothetical protein
MYRVFAIALAATVVGACGGQTRRVLKAARSAPNHRLVRSKTSSNRRWVAHTRLRPQAIVTDESQSLVALVDLRSGQARTFFGVPGDPRYVAAERGAALISSPSTGTVTELAGDPLGFLKVFHGFGSPQVIELSPSGEDAYVTDDARGTLTVLRLSSARVVRKLYVGAGAHHMAFSPDQRQLWIALGESAHTIVILDTSQPESPRIVGRFDPGFAAHDLAFAADGTRVWVSAAGGDYVTVLRARDHRALYRVWVGPPPQHIVIAGTRVYLTSGYGSTIEAVSAATGRLIARARAPYGSFELAMADGFVTTASLLNGELAVFTPQLRLLRVVKIGPGSRDVEVFEQ